VIGIVGVAKSVCYLRVGWPGQPAVAELFRETQIWNKEALTTDDTWLGVAGFATPAATNHFSPRTSHFSPGS